MKLYLPIALAVACIVLVVSLVMTKRGDDAQHESDASAIDDFSNRLDTAQIQIASCEGTIRVFSNSFDESRSASLTFSNQLIETQSTVASRMEQITNLNGQVAELKSENQTLGQSLMDLTNRMTIQIDNLTSRLATTQTNLDQITIGCVLLEDRFRRDVAERVVAERKLNNLSELQAQMKYLQNNPTKEISAEGIFAGLDIVVKSNVFYVSSPD
jgi:chromosome segregation ATPase